MPLSTRGVQHTEREAAVMQIYIRAHKGGQRTMRQGDEPHAIARSSRPRTWPSGRMPPVGQRHSGA